ncbi:MAG: Hsp20/alpha crystallin family protein [Actinomycetota bacterium]|nr:Hsp20/alpha crystallin family protein [Actinomycetota bacterium]
MNRRDDVDRIQEEIEQLFADLSQVSRFAGKRHSFRPPMDVFRTAEPPRLTLVLDLAGVDPDAVELSVTGRTLVVSGERRRPEPDGPVYQQLEIEYGSFQRRIALEEDVDAGAASATYADGMLTVVLPIAERARERVRVPVRPKARP